MGNENLKKKRREKEEQQKNIREDTFLLARTEHIIKDFQRSLYVSREDLEEKCENILQENGVLVITGKQGTGKTHLCYKILSKHVDKRRVYVIKDASELKNIRLNQPSTALVLIDDIVRETDTSSCSHWRWKHDFDSIISDGNAKLLNVVICVKKDLCKSNTILSDYLRSKAESVIDLSSDLWSMKYDDKKVMFEEFCKLHDITIDCTCCDEGASNEEQHLTRNTVEMICKTDPYHGFPRTCRLFFENSENFVKRYRFFKHAQDDLMEDINFLRENKKSCYAILVSTLLLNDCLVLHSGKPDSRADNALEVLKSVRKLLGVEDGTGQITMKNEVRELTKTYLDEYEEHTNVFKFKHENILEATLLMFVEVHPIFFLQSAHPNVILNYARPHGYKSSIGEICFCLPEDLNIHLAESLIVASQFTTNKYGFFLHPSLHPSFNENNFRRCLLQCVEMQFSNINELTGMFQWACMKNKPDIANNVLDIICKDSTDGLKTLIHTCFKCSDNPEGSLAIIADFMLSNEVSNEFVLECIIDNFSSPWKESFRQFFLNSNAIKWTNFGIVVKHLYNLRLADILEEVVGNVSSNAFLNILISVFEEVNQDLLFQVLSFRREYIFCANTIKSLFLHISQMSTNSCLQIAKCFLFHLFRIQQVKEDDLILILSLLCHECKLNIDFIVFLINQMEHKCKSLKLLDVILDAMICCADSTFYYINEEGNTPESLYSRFLEIVLENITRFSRDDLLFFIEKIKYPVSERSFDLICKIAQISRNIRLSWLIPDVLLKRIDSKTTLKAAIIKGCFVVHQLENAVLQVTNYPHDSDQELMFIEEFLKKLKPKSDKLQGTPYMKFGNDNTCSTEGSCYPISVSTLKIVACYYCDTEIKDSESFGQFLASVDVCHIDRDLFLKMIDEIQFFQNKVDKMLMLECFLFSKLCVLFPGSVVVEFSLKNILQTDYSSGLCMLEKLQVNDPVHDRQNKYILQCSLLISKYRNFQGDIFDGCGNVSSGVIDILMHIFTSSICRLSCSKRKCFAVQIDRPNSSYFTAYEYFGSLTTLLISFMEEQGVFSFQHVCSRYCSAVNERISTKVEVVSSEETVWPCFLEVACFENAFGERSSSVCLKSYNFPSLLFNEFTITDQLSVLWKRNNSTLIRWIIDNSFQSKSSITVLNRMLEILVEHHTMDTCYCRCVDFAPCSCLKFFEFILESQIFEPFIKLTGPRVKHLSDTKNTLSLLKLLATNPSIPDILRHVIQLQDKGKHDLILGILKNNNVDSDSMVEIISELFQFKLKKKRDIIMLLDWLHESCTIAVSQSVTLIGEIGQSLKRYRQPIGAVFGKAIDSYINKIVKAGKLESIPEAIISAVFTALRLVDCLHSALYNFLTGCVAPEANCDPISASFFTQIIKFAVFFKKSILVLLRFPVKGSWTKVLFMEIFLLSFCIRENYIDTLKFLIENALLCIPSLNRTTCEFFLKLLQSVPDYATIQKFALEFFLDSDNLKSLSPGHVLYVSVELYAQFLDHSSDGALVEENIKSDIHAKNSYDLATLSPEAYRRFVKNEGGDLTRPQDNVLYVKNDQTVGLRNKMDGIQTQTPFLLLSNILTKMNIGQTEEGVLKVFLSLLEYLDLDDPKVFLTNLNWKLQFETNFLSTLLRLSVLVFLLSKNQQLANLFGDKLKKFYNLQGTFSGDAFTRNPREAFKYFNPKYFPQPLKNDLIIFVLRFMYWFKEDKCDIVELSEMFCSRLSVKDIDYGALTDLLNLFQEYDEHFNDSESYTPVKVKQNLSVACRLLLDNANSIAEQRRCIEIAEKLINLCGNYALNCLRYAERFQSYTKLTLCEKSPLLKHFFTGELYFNNVTELTIYYGTSTCGFENVDDNGDNDDEDDYDSEWFMLAFKKANKMKHPARIKLELFELLMSYFSFGIFCDEVDNFFPFVTEETIDPFIEHLIKSHEIFDYDFVGPSEIFQAYFECNSIEPVSKCYYLKSTFKHSDNSEYRDSIFDDLFDTSLDFEKLFICLLLHCLEYTESHNVIYDLSELPESNCSVDILCMRLISELICKKIYKNVFLPKTALLRYTIPGVMREFEGCVILRHQSIKLLDMIVYVKRHKLGMIADLNLSLNSSSRNIMTISELVQNQTDMSLVLLLGTILQVNFDEKMQDAKAEFILPKTVFQESISKEGEKDSQEKENDCSRIQLPIPLASESLTSDKYFTMFLELLDINKGTENTDRFVISKMNRRLSVIHQIQILSTLLVRNAITVNSIYCSVKLCSKDSMNSLILDCLSNISSHQNFLETLDKEWTVPMVRKMFRTAVDRFPNGRITTAFCTEDSCLRENETVFQVTIHITRNKRNGWKMKMLLDRKLKPNKIEEKSAEKILTAMCECEYNLANIFDAVLKNNPVHLKLTDAFLEKTIISLALSQMKRTEEECDFLDENNLISIMPSFLPVLLTSKWIDPLSPRSLLHVLMSLIKPFFDVSSVLKLLLQSAYISTLEENHAAELIIQTMKTVPLPEIEYVTIFLRHVRPFRSFEAFKRMVKSVLALNRNRRDVITVLLKHTESEEVKKEAVLAILSEILTKRGLDTKPPRLQIPTNDEFNGMVNSETSSTYLQTNLFPRNPATSTEKEVTINLYEVKMDVRKICMENINHVLSLTKFDETELAPLVQEYKNNRMCMLHPKPSDQVFLCVLNTLISKLYVRAENQPTELKTGFSNNCCNEKNLSKIKVHICIGDKYKCLCFGGPHSTILQICASFDRDGGHFLTIATKVYLFPLDGEVLQLFLHYIENESCTSYIILMLLNTPSILKMCDEAFGILLRASIQRKYHGRLEYVKHLLSSPFTTTMKVTTFLTVTKVIMGGQRDNADILRFVLHSDKIPELSTENIMELFKEALESTSEHVSIYFDLCLERFPPKREEVIHLMIKTILQKTSKRRKLVERIVGLMCQLHLSPDIGLVFISACAAEPESETEVDIDSDDDSTGNSDSEEEEAITERKQNVEFSNKKDNDIKEFERTDNEVINDNGECDGDCKILESAPNKNVDNDISNVECVELLMESRLMNDIDEDFLQRVIRSLNGIQNDKTDILNIMHRILQEKIHAS